MRVSRRMAVLFAGATLLSGCYTFAEVDRSALAPGATIRVTVSREEAVKQIDALGGLKERMEGRVQEQTNGSSLALTVRHAATPSEAGRFNAFVSVPWSSVQRVELKRFSPGRTAAIAAGAGVVAALTLSVLEGSSKPGEGEPPPVNDAVRIPLIRFSW